MFATSRPAGHPHVAKVMSPERLHRESSISFPVDIGFDAMSFIINVSLYMPILNRGKALILMLLKSLADLPSHTILFIE